jgi:hypothetical protein
MACRKQACGSNPWAFKDPEKAKNPAMKPGFAVFLSKQIS